MRYGSLEHAYGEPIAAALADDDRFRAWLLRQTKFAAYAESARLLHEEMHAARRAQTWWRSHYTESCRCEGCRGQETDLLAIFEAPAGFRFAVHCELKQPTDVFQEGGRQAESYSTRAACWMAKPPRAVLPHSDATTVLLCSDATALKFAADAEKFDSVITFEEIRLSFPALPLPM